MAYSSYVSPDRRFGVRSAHSSRHAGSKTGDQSRMQTRVAHSSRSRRSDDVFNRMAMRPLYGTAAPELEPQYEADVRVIRPERKAQTQQETSLVPTLIKMAAIVIVVAAALSFMRIMLTSNTVVTMIENDAISSQISEVRSQGTALEMEQSVLTTPAAIRAQAKRLNMTAPSSIMTITLKPDIVAIENGDTLSLSGTIKNVVEIAD